MFKKNNPKVRMRVINFELNPGNKQKIIIDALTYAASKLWNVGNYERKNWVKESGKKYPDWFEQKRNLKEHYWYKNLPSQTAQEVLKMLDESWRSFFKLKKTKGIENPNPPGYKHSNFNIRFLNNGFKVIDRTLRMSVPKNQKVYIFQKHNIKVDYLYIRIPKEYENEDRRIGIELQGESYTSQCSPDAPEVSKEYAQKSNRKHQGLYVTNGKVYNADCVGAYNILKK